MGVAMLSLFLADAHFPELDRTKILLLALLHDFGEIHAGDIVPGKMSLEEKHDLEKAAVERVLAKLPNGKEYLAVWEEYDGVLLLNPLTLISPPFSASSLTRFKSPINAA